MNSVKYAMHALMHVDLVLSFKNFNVIVSTCIYINLMFIPNVVEKAHDFYSNDSFVHFRT